MQTVNLTVRELKEMYPAKFEKEYIDWCSYAVPDDWSETLEGDFREQHGPHGIEARSIWYTVHGPRAGAGFSGVVHMGKLMKHLKLDEMYLPLYQGIEDDGSYCNVTVSNQNFMTLYFDGMPWDTAPSGVFSELSDEAWCELINAQMEEADLENVAREFCKSICGVLHQELVDEYDYLTSEEAFIESCEINEITFEVETEGDEE